MLNVASSIGSTVQHFNSHTRTHAQPHTRSCTYGLRHVYTGTKKLFSVPFEDFFKRFLPSLPTYFYLPFEESLRTCMST